MAYEESNIDDLRVNPANDRHGEGGNEDLAIAELFRLHDTQMRNLAADIQASGTAYDAPLVMRTSAGYTVFDGNRRVTCLKLLLMPVRSPTPELRAYFEKLAGISNLTPQKLTCQVESDRERIDRILLRRHTGSRAGV